MNDTREDIKNEYKELMGCIDKLNKFMTYDERFKTSTSLQRGLLVAQLRAMNEYATILGLQLEK